MKKRVGTITSPSSFYIGAGSGSSGTIESNENRLKQQKYDFGSNFQINAAIIQCLLTQGKMFNNSKCNDLKTATGTIC